MHAHIQRNKSSKAKMRESETQRKREEERRSYKDRKGKTYTTATDECPEAAKVAPADKDKTSKWNVFDFDVLPGQSTMALATSFAKSQDISGGTSAFNMTRITGTRVMVLFQKMGKHKRPFPEGFHLRERHAFGKSLGKTENTIDLVKRKQHARRDRLKQGA